jgi:hypothetical protein
MKQLIVYGGLLSQYLRGSLAVNLRDDLLRGSTGWIESLLIDGVPNYTFIPDDGSPIVNPANLKDFQIQSLYIYKQ